MNRILLFLALLGAGQAVHAQYVYTIKADSVKITNSCDTAELIIENHTQTVPGFLFNKGRGRTEFRKVFQNLTDNTFLIGGDTMKLTNVWFQGGNRFGTTGLLGTNDNYPLTFLQNGVEKGRIATSGNWLFNTTQDRGQVAQFKGDTWTEGTINVDGRVNIAIVPSSSGDNTISIGRDVYVNSNLSAIGIGQFCTVISSGFKAFGVGNNITVTNGIGILGKTERGIAIGEDTYAGPQSIAIGSKTVTTEPLQFVSGSVRPGGGEPITDVYFGSGVQRNNYEGPALGYTIHGSGAYGANEAGGDITIAGGKGTGAGKPGSIIFTTAQPTSYGTTLQGLSEKARFDSVGNFGIGTSNPSVKLHVNGMGRFDNTVITSGHRSAMHIVSGDATVNDTDEYVLVNATSNVTITLPTATGRDGQIFTIKKLNDGNSVTLVSNASQLIDGANSYSLISQWSFVTVVANGGSWIIVATSKNQ
ncbi:hypothetical protein [Niastella sp. OAS944]|uniref:hypothetical protein n=1 Tax=Niastella sp. OAS944 TaxID=2664089 RepID=UPI0034764356|nr:hypothetical protein [Chitinophagaceae bacterium OAS944]